MSTATSSKTKQIRVHLDVYGMIKTLSNGFETPNDVIKRIIIEANLIHFVDPQLEKLKKEK